MCRYYFIYFPMCRHQQTVLDSYCEDATTTPQQDLCEAKKKGKKLSWKERREAKRKGQQGHEQNLPLEHTLSGPVDLFHNLPSSDAIIESLANTSPSIAPQHSSTDIQSTSQDMPTLQPFSSLRGWLGTSNGKPTQAYEEMPAVSSFETHQHRVIVSRLLTTC